MGFLIVFSVLRLSGVWGVTSCKPGEHFDEDWPEDDVIVDPDSDDQYYQAEKLK